MAREGPSANEWTDPPLASRAGARAFKTDCSTCCGVKMFGLGLGLFLVLGSLSSSCHR